MVTLQDIENLAVKEVVTQYPEIGAILARHNVACHSCSVGICLFKNVVKIHNLPPEEETLIYGEITEILRN